MTGRSGSTFATALALFALATNVAADADGGRTSEPERQPKNTREPNAQLSAWTSFRAGVVEAPYPSETLREARSEGGQARLLRFGGAARVATDTWVGAHAAHVMSGVEQPAGSYRSDYVWGNPMLFATLSRPGLWNVKGWTFDAGVSLELGIPVAAERGEVYEQLDRRAFAIGNAIEGWVNSEIFTPNVLPLVVSGSIVVPRQYFQLTLGLELPLLLRLADATIPDGASSSAVGFVPNGEIQFAVWLWQWFGFSLGGTIAWPVAQPVYLSSRSSPPQVMVTPCLMFAVGGGVLLGLEGAIAARGPVSGTASAALSARLAL